MIANILAGLVAYLIGSINFSIMLSKRLAGFDIREKGSGNAGTTNMLRSVGKGAAAITLILDVLKGVAAVLIAFVIGKIDAENPSLLIQIAGIFVILGHTFPIYYGFKGGKGIATSVGILLITNWQIGVICLIFGLLIILLTRMVSAGSVSAAVLFPVLVPFLTDSFLVKGNYIIFGIIVALIVIFNHRSNIKRILDGNENKLGGKK